MNDPRGIGVLLGAALVVGALFAPWYAVELGPEFRNLMSAQTGRLPGEFGQFARELLSLLPDRIVADGWQAFERTDIVLLSVSIGAALAALLDRLDVATAAGAVVVASTLLAMIDRPLPSEVMSLQWGAWLALGGGLLIIVASRLSSPRRASQPVPVYSWTPPPPSASISPPAP